MSEPTEYIVTVRTESSEAWYVYDESNTRQTNFALSRKFQDLSEVRTYIKSLMNSAILNWFKTHTSDECPPRVLAFAGPPTDNPDTFKPTYRVIGRQDLSKRQTHYTELLAKNGTRFGHEHLF